MDPKTRELVAHIADFEVIRTDTAVEALILENELIKRYQPKYNVMLKDSKTYPYLKITDEEWPRVVSPAASLNDGGRYFGPYTSAGSALQALNLLNRLFTYRKCERDHRTDVCLYYHMHQCTAPCIGRRPRRLRARVDGAAPLPLRPGRRDRGRRQRGDAAGGRRLELRARRRAARPDRRVKHVLERQKIVSDKGTNADILAVARGEGDAGVQVGFLRNGKLLGSRVLPDAGAPSKTRPSRSWPASSLSSTRTPRSCRRCSSPSSPRPTPRR